jgi:hypothetical protein
MFSLSYRYRRHRMDVIVIVVHYSEQTRPGLIPVLIIRKRRVRCPLVPSRGRNRRKARIACSSAAASCSTTATSITARSRRRTTTLCGGTSHGQERIIVVETGGLQELKRNRGAEQVPHIDVPTRDAWSDNEDDEEEEHGEEEDSVADDATLAEFRLLEGVDRRTNLTTVRT